ncbi:C40 family peptidase [Aquimarina litoralis]|uniref:C40 family peptidase n=1 Tax=Aquimarina litoralis TaxID=584605 RepID=UPI001C570DC4|nr:C40 family peptidase [Aquimarina litoralis]MBW1297972.1 NlpC/P60 family protein [Aquimarina litoralis]
MKKLCYFLLVMCIILSSCGGAKKRRSVSKKPERTSKRTKVSAKTKKIKSIIDYAKTFEGTRYKYGGTTKRGMDCSGLMYTSFKKEEVVLPRTSKAMATQGTKVSLKNVAIGDLLFFRTNKNKNTINHVGLVVKTGKQIQFIHASTSKGVTISSLDERYWNNCFAGIRRIL